MKKKFERLAEKETAAKVKSRRIISAFLAAFMFVSGGSFGKIAQVGFTAVADDLYDEESPPVEEDNDNADEEDGTDNDTEQEDVPTDEDDGADYDAEQEDESSDGEDETTDEEGDAEFDELYKDDIDILADGDFKPVIKIVPQINQVDGLDGDYVNDSSVWETNATYNNRDNAYILRGKDSVTIFGVTANYKLASDSNDKQGYNNVYRLEDGRYVATDATIWIADEKYGAYGDNWGDQSNLLKRSGNVKYKINTNGLLEVSTTIDSNIPPVDDDGNAKVINAWAVFNNGIDWKQGLDTTAAGWQELYISARPEKSFIEVYSEVADRDMNEVNEYVYDANISDAQKLNVSGQYKEENGVVEIDLNSLCILNNYDTPYLLHPNESVYIKGVGQNTITSENPLTDVAKVGTYPDDNSNQQCIVEYDKDPDKPTGDYTKCTVKGVGGIYCLTYDTGYTDQAGNSVYEKFYIKNYYSGWLTYYDHADIEISDENTYTVDKKVWETNENGETVERKYRIVYDVFVSGVKQSQIFKENDDPVVLKDQYYGQTVPWVIGEGFECNSNRLTGPRIDTNGIIPGTDYWKDPTKKPGDKQFELTSKYERKIEKDENGNVKNTLIYASINDNLRFTMTEVHHVDFYVDLYLKPKSVTVFDDKDQVYKDSATYNIADLSSVTIPDVVFNMDHQSVIDAFNKCPDHSGLDFTFAEDIGSYIQIDPAYQAFKATKIYQRNPEDELEEDKFTFELFYVDFEELKDTYNEGNEYTTEPPTEPTTENNEEEKMDPISLGTVKNDKDGNIIFDERIFNEEGTYTYWIKEVIDEKTKDKTIEYDDGYIEVKVVVKKDQQTSSEIIGNSSVTKDIQKVTFEVESVTYQKYKYNSNGKPVADSLADKELKKFVNINRIYNLPSAGGSGVYIYIISGAGFILAAAVMFYRKRRKEA